MTKDEEAPESASPSKMVSPFSAFREVFGTQVIDSKGRVLYKLKKLGKRESTCVFCNKKSLYEKGEYIGEVQFDRAETGTLTWNEDPNPDSDYITLVVENIHPIIHGNDQDRSLHFVIVESLGHLTEFHKLSERNIKGTLFAYSKLMEKYHEQHACTVLYKNQGPMAQSSQGHVHSQMIFSDGIPSRIISNLKELFPKKNHGSTCLICKRIEELIKTQSKVILKEYKHWMEYCPKHMYPYVIRLLPKRHVSDLLMLQEAEIDELASILKTSTNRIIGNFGDIDYNILWHQAPRIFRSRWHLFIEIVPRGVNEPAGFEMITGIRITENPEAAADALRDVKTNCVMCANYFDNNLEVCPFCGYNKVHLSYKF